MRRRFNVPRITNWTPIRKWKKVFCDNGVSPTHTLHTPSHDRNRFARRKRLQATIRGCRRPAEVCEHRSVNPDHAEADRWRTLRDQARNSGRVRREPVKGGLRPHLLHAAVLSDAGLTPITSGSSRASTYYEITELQVEQGLKCTSLNEASAKGKPKTR